MAYGQQQGQQRNYGSNSNSGSSYGRQNQAAKSGESKPSFEKDPNEAGIGYEKTSDKIGKYMTVTVSRDIPAGTKLVIFENKTKNRTDKTPTHVVKLSVSKSESK